MCGHYVESIPGGEACEPIKHERDALRHSVRELLEIIGWLKPGVSDGRMEFVLAAIADQGKRLVVLEGAAKAPGPEEPRSADTRTVRECLESMITFTRSGAIPPQVLADRASQALDAEAESESATEVYTVEQVDRAHVEYHCCRARGCTLGKHLRGECVG